MKQSSTNRLWFIAMSDVICSLFLYLFILVAYETGASDSLVDKLKLISYLIDWFVLDMIRFANPLQPPMVSIYQTV